MRTHILERMDKAKTAAKRVKRALKERPELERGRITLYLYRRTYKAFRAECEALEISASQALEELMRAFVDRGT